MPRNNNSRIRVTYPDNESICYRNAINTVIEVLKRVDPTRYPEIPIESSGRRLITNQVHEDDDRYKKQICDGWWYINKFSNTYTRVAHLRTIKKVLNLDITIESGSNFEITNIPENNNIRRRPQRLCATFEDGYILDNDNVITVFRDFIYHVGVDNVAQRCQNIQWRREPFIMTTNRNNNRAQLGEYRWFLEPTNAKEAKKILTIISISCNVNCTIEIY